MCTQCELCSGWILNIFLNIEGIFFMLQHEVYFNNHIKSLFISKFFYFSRSEILKLKSIRVSILGQVSNFPIIVLFLYLLTGFWPKVRNLTKRARNGTIVSRLEASSLFTDTSFVFMFLYKFVNVYLPSVESWAYKTNMLVFCKKNMGFFSLKLRSLFYIFFELDFLLNFSFTFLKVLTSDWLMEIFFETTSTRTVEQQSFLRFFMFPV